MPACFESSSDSESVVSPSVLRTRSHRKVFLSDSDSDMPQAAYKQRSAAAINQHVVGSQTTAAQHVQRFTAATKQDSPRSRHHRATSHATAACARSPTQRKAQPAAAADLADCMEGLLLDVSESVSAQPEDSVAELIVPWPDASSPGSGTTLAGMGDRVTAQAAPSATVSCRTISDGSSSGCLTFTQRTQRRGFRLDSSDSDVEQAAGSSASEKAASTTAAADVPTAALPAQTVRRLSFAAPGLPLPAPGSRQPLPVSQLRASVRWADALPAVQDDSLVTSLQALQLGTCSPAAPAGTVDLYDSAHTDADSGPDSPEVAWGAAHTPRRQRAVLSDNSSSEGETAAAARPAASYRSPLSDAASSGDRPGPTPGCDFLPTPWRCTPPWAFPASQPRPRAAPATAPRGQLTEPALSPAPPAVAMPRAVISPAAPDQVHVVKHLAYMPNLASAFTLCISTCGHWDHFIMSSRLRIAGHHPAMDVRLQAASTAARSGHQPQSRSC